MFRRFTDIHSDSHKIHKRFTNRKLEFIEYSRDSQKIHGIHTRFTKDSHVIHTGFTGFTEIQLCYAVVESVKQTRVTGGYETE